MIVSRARRIAAPERVGPHWLLGALGKGGTAEVFVVTAETPVGLAKIEVLKRPRGDFDDPELVSMFIDEGRVGSRLNHPNVVRTTDVELYAGRPHITMEYVEGQSLHRVVHDARAGRLVLEPGLCLYIITEVLQGLSYAHTLHDFDGSPLRIVHRDVSPGNILLSYAGEVKLCDFGIASAALRRAHTQPGIIKGKANYMAPEQKQDGGFDHRADIYALGVVAWELFAGRALGEAATQPPSLAREGGDVSPELDAIIARALAVDPNERFESAEEMLEALERLKLVATLKLQRKRLSKLLTTTYEAERRERSSLVKKRLDRVLQGLVGEQLPRLHGTGDSLPPEPTSVSLRPPVQAGPENTAPKGSVAQGAVAAALVGVLVGGLVLFVQLQSSDPAARTSSPAPPASVSETARPPGAPATPDPQLVELTVDVSPSEATLIFDGERVTEASLKIVRPASTKEHQLLISAAGYKTVERWLVLECDTVLRVSLETVDGLPYPTTITPAPRRPEGATPPLSSAPRERHVHAEPNPSP